MIAATVTDSRDRPNPKMIVGPLYPSRKTCLAPAGRIGLKGSVFGASRNEGSICVLFAFVRAF